MFGYVRIYKPELKIRDYETYRGFYCGLCERLKTNYGFAGRLTLTYDMTFLILLLSSVYDIAAEQTAARCAVHPVRKRLRLTNEITDYAANINMLLVYHHFQDDFDDEGKKRAWLGMQLYKRKSRRAAALMEQKEAVIAKALSDIAGYETRGEREIDMPADAFGRILSEIFDWRAVGAGGDGFAEPLRRMGFWMGRFVYLMDAYDDLEADRKSGAYNALKEKSEDAGFEDWIYDKLETEMSRAAAEYRRLPCIAYREILDNIIYAGVWNRYDRKRKEEKSNE